MNKKNFRKALVQRKELEENKEIILTGESGLNKDNLKDFGFQFVNSDEDDESSVSSRLYIYGDKYYCLKSYGDTSSHLFEISKKKYNDALKYIFYDKRYLRAISHERCGYDYFQYCEYVKEMRNQKELLERRKIGYPYFYSNRVA